METTKQFTMKLHLINGIPMNVMITQEKTDELANFELRPDDLFIATYPKSGTTWMQQIVKLILSNGVDDGVLPQFSCPWLEADDYARNLVGQPPVDYKTAPSPRTFKSHSPYSMVAGGDPAKSPAKYIYVMRNPKDTAVSFFHHTRAVPNYEYEGDWDDFFERFMSGNVDQGSWFDHVLQWWEHRETPNILFLTFEDMKKDGEAAVAKVAKFMGCSLEPSTIDKIVSEAAFDKMKNHNNFVNKYRRPGEAAHFRKGIVGDWKNYFSEEQSARMDAECSKKLAGTGLDFLYD